jgi:hypothetical protein
VTQGRGRGGRPGGKLRVAVSSPRAAASYLGGTLFFLAFLASRRRERGGELEVAGRGGSAWLNDQAHKLIIYGVIINKDS